MQAEQIAKLIRENNCNINDVLQLLKTTPSSVNHDSIESNKIVLLIKNEQSGKTRIVLDDIHTNNKTISLIISDNNTLLLNATTKRAFESDLVVGKITCKANKKYEWKGYEGELDLNKIKRDRLRIDEAIQKDIDCLIVCGNKWRFEDINNMIENNPNVMFNIWIDEADKIINKNRSHFVNNWRFKYKNVHNITMITATPFDIDVNGKNEKWIGDYFDDEILLYSLDESHGEGYMSLDNAVHINHCQSYIDNHDDDVDEIIREKNILPNDIDDFKKHHALIHNDYCKSYLDLQAPNPGEVWMIPGKREKSTHKFIENLCFGKYESSNDKTYNVYEQYFDVVITLNGSDKSIKYYKKDSYETETTIVNSNKHGEFGYNKEVNEWLSEWYKHNDGKHLRVAITGHICISRGITISSSYVQITHILINNGLCSSIADYKQLISRICGYKYYHEENNKFVYYPYVICPQDLWENLMKLHNICCFMIKKATDDDCNKVIHKKDILEYIRNENMNILQGKRDRIRWTIPIRLSLDRHIYIELNRKNGNKYNETNIVKYINTHTHDSIMGYDTHEITTPQASYDKIMKPIISHSNINKEYPPSLRNEEKNLNKKLCSIHFDSKHHDIYILRYNGDIDIDRSL